MASRVGFSVRHLEGRQSVGRRNLNGAEKTETDLNRSVAPTFPVTQKQKRSHEKLSAVSLAFSKQSTMVTFSEEVGRRAAAQHRKRTTNDSRRRSFGFASPFSRCDDNCKSHQNKREKIEKNNASGGRWRLKRRNAVSATTGLFLCGSTGHLHQRQLPPPRLPFLGQKARGKKGISNPAEPSQQKTQSEKQELDYQME